jgi:hypothetical protein
VLDQRTDDSLNVWKLAHRLKPPSMREPPPRLTFERVLWLL